MKLLPKFALLSIGVAAVPLAIAGYSSIRVSQAALREAIEGHEVLLARQRAHNGLALGISAGPSSSDILGPDGAMRQWRWK